MTDLTMRNVYSVAIINLYNNISLTIRLTATIN